MATEFDVNFKPTQSPVAETRGNLNNLQAGFTGAIQGQTKVPNLIEGYDAKYGVPQMQQSIQRGTEQFDMLGNQIRGMDKTVAQGSQESLLTQGQKNNLVQSKQAPLMEQQNLLGQNLARQGQNLATAQSNAARMVEAEQIQQQKELSPWLQAFDNEKIVSAMAMTGWTFENQSELSRLLANQQAGITLSEGEKNRALQLSLQEMQFEQAMKQQTQQQQFQMSQPGANLMTMGAGTHIYDPAKGQFVGMAPYKAEKPTPSFDINAAIAALKQPNMSTNSGPINSLWGF